MKNLISINSNCLKFKVHLLFVRIKKKAKKTIKEMRNKRKKEERCKAFDFFRKLSTFKIESAPGLSQVINLGKGFTTVYSDIVENVPRDARTHCATNFADANPP